MCKQLTLKPVSKRKKKKRSKMSATEAGGGWEMGGKLGTLAMGKVKVSYIL